MINEKKNEKADENYSNTGFSQNIKKHGCGCCVIVVVMCVLSLILSLIMAPFLPKDDEGAIYPLGYLFGFYSGVFLIISGFYYYFGKLKRCRVSVDARKLVLTGSEISESPVPIYPPNENNKSLDHLCIFEYHHEGKMYRKKRIGRINKTTNDLSKNVIIRINPNNPTEIFYLKTDLPIFIGLVLVGAIIAAPVFFIILKSVSTGAWLHS